jgi:hypothetical protein
MSRGSASALGRLRRWRDFQEARVRAEHQRREGERMRCESESERVGEAAQSMQRQRAGLLEAPELDLDRIAQAAAIETHAWKTVERAGEALDAACEAVHQAHVAHLRAREASRVVAQRHARREAEAASREEKALFDQMADVLAARRTPR